jgi:AraC family transcriptional regulator, transcriptional activator of pobA
MKTIPIRHINSNPVEPKFSGSFSIRKLSDLLNGDDMVQALHRHDFYFVLVLDKGSGRHEIDFTPYTVGNHTIFMIRPGQVHTLTLKAGATGYLMQFKSDFYYPQDKATNQILRHASKKNLCQAEKTKFSKLYAVLDNIFEEFNSRQESYEEVIKANLGIFFIELLRNRKHKTPADSSHSYEQGRLEKFHELLEQHAAVHKLVSFYADQLNVSVYQLNAIAKRVLGKTPSELINEYIILEARRHLLATSSQVNQIANALGYEDVSYFIRFFKKHTGHSPEVYRQNLQNFK